MTPSRTREPPDLGLLFDALPGAYLVLLPDAPVFTIVAASDAYLHATLTTRAEAIGRGLFEVFPDPAPRIGNGGGGPDLRTSLETVLRTGAPDRMSDHRYDLRRPDGSREARWWAALNTPVHGPGGDVRYILHQAEDVTERASRSRFQQLARALERLSTAPAHERLLDVIRDAARELVGAAGASLVVRDDGECYYVSADSHAGPLWMGQRFPLERCISGWVMLNDRPALVPDVSADPRVPAEVYAPTFVRSLVMVPVGSPEPFAAIGAYWAEERAPDAEEVAVLQTLARVAAEVLTRERSSAAARAAEAALRESEARYRMLFDSIEAGFCVIEVLFDEHDRACDYRFLEVNRSFERQTGLTDAVGRRMRELVPDHEEYWFERYGDVVRSGERVRFEHPAQGLGGRWFDVDAFPVGDPAQRRVAVLFNDISERLRTGERLREAGRLEAVGALAGGVAHEANNQMSVVLGFADFVLRRDDLSAEVRQDVEQMRRAAERTALVTGQLLAFGRRQVLHPAVLDLNRIVRDLVPVLRRTIGVNSDLVLRLADATVPVRADSRQLDQVLLNLALNARDAMPAGGTLTIRTARIRIEGPPGTDSDDGERVPPGRYVQLSVEDTGEGVNEADRLRIFEPFYTTKATGQGTGLGLASVYGIVKQSGGYIRVEAPPGGGARFVIHLPEVQESPQVDDGGAPRPARGTGEVVLVVEDEPAVRAILARVLTDEGYRVVTAEDGRAAMELLEREQVRPAVVLTDVVMPRMGGRELARRLDERHPGVPVVFLSGHAYDGEERPAGLAGDVPFVQKPVAPEQLVRIVRECCQRAGNPV